MRRTSVVLVVVLLFGGWAYNAEACPKPPTCVCDCKVKCTYGKVCKKVKECKTYKKCKKEKVCSFHTSKYCSCKKVKVCHISGGYPYKAHTICVSKSAVKAHLGNHGDYLGKCKKGCKVINICKAKKCCKYVTKCECAPYKSKCPPCKCPPCKCPGPNKDAGVTPDKGVPPQIDKGVSPQEDKGVSPQEDGGLMMIAPGSNKWQGPISRVSDVGVPEPDCGTCEPIDPNSVPEGDMELIGGGGCNVGSTTGGLGMGLIFVLGLLVAFRKKATSVIVALALVCAAGGSAYAAEPMNLDNDDYFKTLNSDTLGHKNMNFSLSFEYIHRPLRIVTKPGGDPIVTLVKFRQNMNFMASVGFGSWFQLDLSLPLMLGQNVRNYGALGLDSSVEDVAFYDFQVTPRVKLFGTPQFSLGVAMPITLPTANQASFVGEESATVTPMLLVGLRTEYFQADLNAGYLARNDQSYNFKSQHIKSDDEFVYGLGVRIPLFNSVDEKVRVDLIGDIWGAISVYEQNKEELLLEAMGGLQVHLRHNVVVGFGAGGGLTQGIGTSQYRLMWSFGWEFEAEKPKPCVPQIRTVTVRYPVLKKVVERVEIVKHKIILPPVFFAFDKDVVLEQSYPTLQAVADLLNKYAFIKEIFIEGNTDSRGSDGYNMDLGKRRAKNIYHALVKMGVQSNRMVDISLGEFALKVPNAKTKRDHARNRRVEFNILKPKQN